MYRLVATYIQTYIHMYSDFLIVLISVGLTQARPNYTSDHAKFNHIVK